MEVDDDSQRMGNIFSSGSRTRKSCFGPSTATGHVNTMHNDVIGVFKARMKA